MPIGLHLHLSNRLEQLVDELAEVVRQPIESVFVPETIVVPSSGMSRWLRQELAVRLGVCTNVDFPFPQRIIADLFAAALPDVPQSKAYSASLMTWRIMRLLPGLADTPAFAAVRSYLLGDRAELRRYQLSVQIARLFDRYLAFRPEMIREWDAGRDPDDWQAILWRSLSEETGDTHQVELARQLEMRLRSKRSLPNGMPVRLSFFGISTLPPFHVELLGAIGKRIEVHLFLMQPTRFLWSHLMSVREESRMRRQGGPSPEDLHFERGNPLLTSLGKLGGDFLEAIADLEPATISDRIEDSDRDTVLGMIQADILEIDEPDRSRAPEGDTSVVVASCYSPMREVEALHDALLERFEKDPELRPRDVLVMMPGVEDYAPRIEAVFGAAESANVEIPFSIADRGPRAASGATDALLRLLELAGTRLTAAAVLDVLESPSVLRRFDLAEPDLETIRTWVAETRVRWGEDAGHRGEFGVPEFTRNSWRAGLDRLLLGYALPGQGKRMFADVLPYDEIEGGSAETLGNFVEFTARLFETMRELKKPRRLDGWRDLLLAVIDRFLDASSETERELVPLRRTLDALEDLRKESGFTEPVSLEIVLSHLGTALNEPGGHGGYLAGQVTFCTLKPMRSIPFKLICLLGMNDGAFPRGQPTLEFDRITCYPKRGDRTAREDDRYLFLETLLSARGALYISYVGQSMKDGSHLPPSVVVSELLDYAERRFEGEGNGVVRVEHRLQAFSSEYFGNGPLFSYSQENGRAARVAAKERRALPAFISEPLPEMDEEWRRIELEQLVRFFANPARFFIQKRLSIRMPDEEATLEDREPFAVDPLSGYGIKQTILERVLDGAEPGELRPMFEAQGILPPRHAGEASYRSLAAVSASVAENIRACGGGDSLPPRPVDLAFGDWSLTGTIRNLTGSGLFRYRAAKLKAKDLIALWIPLLAINCEAATPGVLVAEDTVVRFEPVPDSRERITELAGLYRRGLCEPLPFFPETSLAFVKAEAEGKKNPVTAAEAAWYSETGHGPNESADSFIGLAFHHSERPLDGQWEEIARAVFGPLVSAMKKGKG